MPIGRGMMNDELFGRICRKEPPSYGMQRMNHKALLTRFCVLVAAGTLSGQLQAKDPGVLAASVKPFVERDELAGAVMLVADREKVLALEAAGWADVEARKPMRPDSIFWIASQSKPVTAAAFSSRCE